MDVDLDTFGVPHEEAGPIEPEAGPSGSTSVLDTHAPELPTMDLPDGISRRTVRARFLPRKLRDNLPEGPLPIRAEDVDVPEIPAPPPEPSRITRVTLRVRRAMRTVANSFGLYREYKTEPSRIPDELEDIEDVTERPAVVDEAPTTEATPAIPAVPLPSETSPANLGPFPNMSTLRFAHYFWNSGSTKSVGDRTRLVEDVLHAPDFKPEDIQVAQLAKLDRWLDGRQSKTNPCPPEDGWIEKKVTIRVPDGQPHVSETDAPTFDVPGFFHRRLTQVITASHAAPEASSFHYVPFKQFCEFPNSERPTERVVDEMYTTDAYIEADEQIQKLPPEPNCTLPRAVAAVLFASDAMQLTSFGDAKAWPGYIYEGNQTKWLRNKPKARAAHQFAFFPSVRRGPK